LTLKTFDPTSGTLLKYKTDKAAEVGRLIASLGTLGRHMASLPEIAEGRWCFLLSSPEHCSLLGDTETAIDASADQGTGTHTPLPEATMKDAKSVATEPKTGQGGGKKKKKGKKWIHFARMEHAR
jgi:hypothetical protein